jgi:hypothetical protein
MKKDDLALAIQVLANVGILASLVFLAIEIRGNTVAMRSQEIGSLFEQDQAFLTTTTERDMGALYVKSLYRLEELTMEELQRLTSLLSTRMNILRRINQAYEDGVARREDWEERVNAVPIYLGTPFGRVWWEHIKADYAETPDFVEAVDAALRNSTIVPDDAWLLTLEQDVRNLGRSTTGNATTN